LSKKKKNKKKRVGIILLILLFLIGLGVFLYPVISRIIVNKQVEENLQDLKDDLSEIIAEAEKDGKLDMDDMPLDEDGNPAPYKKIRYDNDLDDKQPYLDELYQFMLRRNRELYESGQSELDSPDDYKYPEIDVTKYGVESAAVGTLEIEKLNLELPMFLGANDNNLSAGCGHLTYTTYPIGGNNTNCVIAVHRGLGGSDFLRHVDKLQNGDIIRLQNYWYTMEYRVVDSVIVEPDAVKSILIQPGKDMLTLYTCHPYGINSQRYLVYCERVLKS
jgi:sortase A